MSFRIQNGQVIPTQQRNRRTDGASNKFEKAFIDSLNKEKSTVKISAHAVQRMDQRQIKLNDEDMIKINDAVETLDKKGAKESLLLYKDAAFIASIRNRTIITAMKDGELDTITNIDSAVKIK
ncbi:TIGR02530 family flagellar biosynthesis protein [Alkalibacter mobilis]|uniref:TIGR02530 family flagellar biosynthesis protein n=1 Tax=Alkalibacter mobilis TaxID=2787712 RepID=UPI0018A02311|nr:TIGR02530 family flagellar biosynthesis protein [Alkalibacter mobilis]MBF7096317.1 hypothetical protein [Alkalibacter mobilis]